MQHTPKGRAHQSLVHDCALTKASDEGLPSDSMHAKWTWLQQPSWPVLWTKDTLRILLDINLCILCNFETETQQEQMLSTSSKAGDWWAVLFSFRL